jgi:hypothetical protein
MDPLTLTIDFTIGDGNTEDRFKLGGSIKPEMAHDVIAAWLSSQVGAGPDGSTPNRKDSYHIEIDWNPDGDKLTCRSDCGYEGLLDGILMHFHI